MLYKNEAGLLKKNLFYHINLFFGNIFRKIFKNKYIRLLKIFIDIENIYNIIYLLLTIFAR
jgi:hypothetical protein